MKALKFLNGMSGVVYCPKCKVLYYNKKECNCDVSSTEGESKYPALTKYALGNDAQDTKSEPRCRCGHKESEHIGLLCNYQFTGYGGGKRCSCEKFQEDTKEVTKK